MHRPSQNAEKTISVCIGSQKMDPEAINGDLVTSGDPPTAQTSGQTRSVTSNGHRVPRVPSRSDADARNGANLALLPTRKLPLDLGCHLQQVPPEKGVGHVPSLWLGGFCDRSLSATKCSPLLLCPYHFRSALMGWVFVTFASLSPTAG